MTNITPINRREARKLAVRKVFAGPQADGEPSTPARSDVAAAIGELNSAFEQFKAENDKALADLKKGRDDVVQNEKVDRINASITDLEQTVEGMANQLQAAMTAGSGVTAQDEAKRKYNQAFAGWMRGDVDDRQVAALATPDAVKAAATSDKDQKGGMLVPDAAQDAITRIQGTMSVMRSISTVMSISTNAHKVPKSTGGATSGWVGERDTRTETDTPNLSVITIPAHEIYAMPAASQELLDDAAVDVASWLASEVAIEFDEEEGDAFINGDGVEKPKGFLSETTVANASWAWGKLGFTVTGNATTIDSADDAIDLVYSLKPGYRAAARWLMNDATTAIVRKLKDGDGNYIWQPGAQAGEPATLFGYPVSHDDNMPDVGADAFPVAFGDFSRGYRIVDRIGVRILRDPYSSKPYVLFYTTKRVGGGVSDFQAIKLFKCST